MLAYIGNMARKTKEIRLWTLRNGKGQFLATYFALTAEQAIGKLIADQGRDTATFRKSGTRCDFSNVTAIPKEPNP